MDAGKVRDAADQLISAGLAAHGYLYVNIDDTWEAGRDANGVIQTNDKFPDMKALADYVHSKGPADRHLLLARPQDLRRLHGKLAA